MPRKKATRRRRAARKIRKYFRKKKIPIIPVATLGTTFLVGGKDGYSSPLHTITHGDWVGLADNLITGWIPFVESYRGNVKLGFGVPRYLAMMLGASFASKIAGWLGLNRMFSNMPSPLNKLKL